MWLSIKSCKVLLLPRKSIFSINIHCLLKIGIDLGYLKRFLHLKVLDYILKGMIIHKIDFRVLLPE